MRERDSILSIANHPTRQNGIVGIISHMGHRLLPDVPELGVVRVVCDSIESSAFVEDVRSLLHGKVCLSAGREEDHKDVIENGGWNAGGVADAICREGFGALLTR